MSPIVAHRLADDERLERADGGDLHVVAAPDREREPVALQPVSGVGADHHVRGRVVRVRVHRVRAVERAATWGSGRRTSPRDVMTAGNMGCLVATDGRKSSDDCVVKRVCSDEPRMFRVDAHHHLWDLAVRDQPWIDGPALAPLRRSFGVDDLSARGAGHRRDRRGSDRHRARGDTRPSGARGPARADRRRRRLGRSDGAGRGRRARRAGARVARRHPPPGPGRARSALAVPRRRARRLARGRRRRPRLRPAHAPAAAAGGDRDGARAGRPRVRRRPPLQAADRERGARAVGDAHAHAGGARERRLQALGDGHRSRLGDLDRGRPAALRGRPCSRPSGRTG